MTGLSRRSGRSTRAIAGSPRHTFRKPYRCSPEEAQAAGCLNRGRDLRSPGPGPAQGSEESGFRGVGLAVPAPLP